MLDIAEQYMTEYGSAREAIPLFVRDLMANDPAHHKRGYTRENAIIAAAEAFDISRDAVEELIP